MSEKFIMSSAIFLGALIVLGAGIGAQNLDGLSSTDPSQVSSCEDANSSTGLFGCGLDTFGSYIGALQSLSSENDSYLGLIVFVPLALTGIFVVVKSVIPG